MTTYHYLNNCFDFTLCYFCIHCRWWMCDDVLLYTYLAYIWSLISLWNRTGVSCKLYLLVIVYFMGPIKNACFFFPDKKGIISATIGACSGLSGAYLVSSVNQ